MKRKKVTAAFEHVLKAAKSLARLASAKAIVLLADDVLDFREIKRLLRGSRVLIGAENPEVFKSGGQAKGKSH